MSKDAIKIISFVLAIVLLLVGINHCQDYRAEQEAAASTAETTQQEIEQNGYTVYVSRYDIIHKNPNCSGMIYYTEMGYYDAVAAGYTHCQNCY